MKRSYSVALQTLVAIILSVLMCWPLVYVVAMSFKTSDRPTIRNYTELLHSSGLVQALVNSVLISSWSALGATAISASAAYALARYEIGRRRVVNIALLVAIAVPTVILISPLYVVLHRLGLLDTYAAAILPAVALAIGVYFFRQVILSCVNENLMDAARLDGCQEAQLFAAVIVPTILPAINAYTAITFVAAWNNYLGCQIVLQSDNKMPLTVAIAQIRNLYSQDLGLLMAGIVVSIVPLIVVFLLFQGTFVHAHRASLPRRW